MNTYQPNDRVAFTTAKGYAMTGTIITITEGNLVILAEDGHTYRRALTDTLGHA